MTVSPVFVDGLIGPTYHYGGLAFGNVLSQKNAEHVSYPKKAALQGLEKMWQIRQQGFAQYVFPPVQKHIKESLNRVGSSWNPDSLVHLSNHNMLLLSALFSSSSCWLANACHITSAIDSVDGNFHVTPANSVHSLHRSLDVPGYDVLLRRLFEQIDHVRHHEVVPASFSDEGMANSCRFSEKNLPGLLLQVYGKEHGVERGLQYPARQSKEAFLVLQEQHPFIQMPVLVQQSSKAIDAGVFHNDVIAFGTGSFLVCHEKAFEQQTRVLDQLKQRFLDCYGQILTCVVIPNEVLSLHEAVQTYFFNSQCMINKEGRFVCLVSDRCQHYPGALEALSLCKDAIPSFMPVMVNCEESIKNGGGPACLRLSFVANESDISKLNNRFLLTERLYQQLEVFIMSQYPDDFDVQQLSEFSFLEEQLQVLAAMNAIFD